MRVHVIVSFYLFFQSHQALLEFGCRAVLLAPGEAEIIRSPATLSPRASGGFCTDVHRLTNPAYPKLRGFMGL